MPFASLAISGDQSLRGLGQPGQRIRVLLLDASLGETVTDRFGRYEVKLNQPLQAGQLLTVLQLHTDGTQSPPVHLVVKEGLK